MIKVAINGAGRIGRSLYRLSLLEENIAVTEINDLIEPEQLFYLMKYDSVHGELKDLEFDGKNLVYKSKKTKLNNYSSNKDFNPICDVLIDSTGVFNRYKDNLHHIENGVKKVIVSSMTEQDIKPVILGVNEKNIDERIISAGSCTTIALAIATKILDDAFGIEKLTVTSVHSYNSNQNLLDSKTNLSIRLSRSSTVNMIPVKTGAGENLEKIYPKLQGKVKGSGMRVPTPDVSLLDTVYQLKKESSKSQIIEAFRKSDLKENMELRDGKSVSSDLVGNRFALSVDFDSILVSNNLAKIILWHDNEHGYASYLINLIKRVS
ncbi:MAG: hypothetical protein OIF32_06075 [Campylobacterales bacterium]|nr:hypothetical protein [Campylobacterales bacterium]